MKPTPTPDVINLVVAAREFWDANNDLSAESRALDKALEAFSSLVPYENEPDDAALSVQPAAAVVGEPEPLTFPREMTDDLRDVLSKMMWNTGPIAHVLRAGGADIKTRAEDEQAHVLHWLICLVLEHGSEWRVKASERITEIRAALGGANHE